MTFSKLTTVWNHHHYLASGHFYHPKVYPISIKQSLLITPPPPTPNFQPPATTNLFLVSTHLLFLGISQK